eukprot:m.21079 g.21079  ORF g.21079 m.21079 type:complete len:411 (-) comp8679_c0_seq1:130-1362(-)
MRGDDGNNEDQIFQTEGEEDMGYLYARKSLFPKSRSSTLLSMMDNEQASEERPMLLEMLKSTERSDRHLNEQWEERRARIHKSIIERNHSVHTAAVVFTKDLHIYDPQRSDSIASNISFLSSGFTGCNDVYNLINAGVLNPFIHSPDYLVLVDVRSRDQYDAGHIVTANHKSLLPPLFDHQCGSVSFVIIYDEDGHELGSACEYCEQLQRAGAENVCVLAGGINKFSRRYPFLCKEKEYVTMFSLEDRLKALATTFPSEIVVGKIFLGNRRHAQSDEVITSLQITHILNVTTDEQNMFERSVTYLRLPVQDEPTEDLFQFFERASHFIAKSVKEAGARILVHCVMGVSRSTTCLIAYFIKECKWSLKEAIDHIADKRQGIRPNYGFLRQLLRWEELHLGKKITDIDSLPF